MLDFWLRVSLPVVFSVFLALLLWMLYSSVAALSFMVLVLLGVVVRHAWPLYKLGEWLKDAQIETIPEMKGIWDDVFSRLYQMVKRHQQTKQNLANELLHIEQATAALPVGVTSLNEANRIEWCNPLGEQHFGLNAKRDIFQDITYFVRQPEFIDYLKANDFSEPLVMKAARHDEMILSIKLVHYGDNKRLLISRDVTQLQRIETMRRDFVANVSHEMRTPLTVVNGFVENLQDMTDLSHDKIYRALHLMAEQTARMDHLVSDLLTLSHLESDQNTFMAEQVDMTSLLNEVLQDGKMLSADRHKHSLEMAGPLEFLGNREELRSAFSNLVSNAVRYTPEGGDIILRWTLCAGQPVFSVQDSGIGIETQHIPRLTERFYRVDRSRSRETGGTGLGLAIVKHIALRHHARLEVESEEGCGSIFSLVFSL
ncbi:MAG: phosphate regulon sensor histidine kinase PhoR [Gallionella sp.]